ncbi:MAG: FAD:protein FMN transferase [Gemmatimonadota bacterium]
MLSRVAFFFGFIIVMFAARGAPVCAQVRHEYSEVHMGMPVRIVLFAATDSAAGSAARAAFQHIARLDDDLTDYRPVSELRKIEAHAGDWVSVKPSTFIVLARAIEIAQRTDGAFDPTIGPVVTLWRAARRAHRLPDRAALDSARALVSYKWLLLDSARNAVRLHRAGMRLDLGGIAKGFILQQALATLERNGVTRALLEAGGDIVVGAPPPAQPGWRIDVPGADSSFQAAAAKLTHSALATSGPSEQYLEIGGTRYSHVVDPRTALGLTNRITVHTIASDGATADALATALTVIGRDRASTILARFPGILASTRKN